MNRVSQLGLAMMGDENTDALRTAYTVTIDAVRRYGVTTGISASDQAATIQVTLAGTNGGIPASAVPITLANTGLLPAGFKTIAGAGLARTLSSLFPFSDGFAAWAGSCADADPEGLDATGTRFWPGANRDNAITVDPGGTAATTIAMPTVDIEFERDTPGASVTAPPTARRTGDGKR